MSSIEKDLAKEFMNESLPIEESELSSLEDHGDFVTFTVNSKFSKLDFEKSLTSYEHFKQNNQAPARIKLNVIYQLTYDVSFTDLNSEELYYEPIDQIKNVKCQIIKITTSNEHIDNVKLKEHFMNSKEFINELIEHAYSEGLTIDRFKPFALEQYM